MEDIKFIDSKFRLVILAAKRAKQLVRGSKKKVNMHAENPLTIALKEIELGLINFEIISEADEQLALESLQRIGKETKRRDEQDLLSFAGDDDDDEYEEEVEEEVEADEDVDDEVDEDIDEDIDADVDDDVDDYDEDGDDLDSIDPDDMIDDDDD